MPTIANATIVAHLYGEPKTGTNGDKKWCQFRAWTADKVKGQEKKAFTSWQGFVNGPQAEWLARDGKKGSLVYISGAIRIDTYEKEGKTHSRIEFTRVNECRILDRDDSEYGAPAPAAQSAPPPQRSAPSATAQTDDGECPF